MTLEIDSAGERRKVLNRPQVLNSTKIKVPHFSSTLGCNGVVFITTTSSSFAAT
jgi:hypothetical protein